MVLNYKKISPFSYQLLRIPMLFPIISVIIVQKLIFRKKLINSFGISFKLNLWFLYAALIPILMALLIYIIFLDAQLFSIKTFIINILIGLSIASISALFEELAWRGFLYNIFITIGK